MTEGKPAAVHPLRIPGLASALAMQVHAVTDVHVSAEIAATGIWEPQETQFLLDTLRPGDVFVDAGGNLWYCTTGGTPGTWQPLAGVSASYVPIDPARVYDSRWPDPRYSRRTGTR